MVKKYNFLDTLKKHGYVVVDEGNLLNHVHNLNLVHNETDGNHGWSRLTLCSCLAQHLGKVIQGLDLNFILYLL